jgi:predicted phage gp36 major capsid-like protein
MTKHETRARAIVAAWKEARGIDNLIPWEDWLSNRIASALQEQEERMNTELEGAMRARRIIADAYREQEETIERLREACGVIATAELYDPATGIIDAEVLDIAQEVARAALSGKTP